MYLIEKIKLLILDNCKNPMEMNIKKLNYIAYEIESMIYGETLKKDDESKNK